MNCFNQFKEKVKSRAQKSAPVLKNRSKSSYADPEPERATKSSSFSNEPRGIPELYQERAHNLRAFTLPELKQATSNFSRLLKIGEGGFGCVYKGTIKPVDGKGDATVVAVKKLNRDGHQGHKQWFAEVQFLGVVDHPNLVKLIGYCAVDGERGIQRMLVYEYMPNKSLENHLFDGSRPGLSWEHRLRVILGSARGLAYLHEELEIQVIFRDFKSSNVLLDEDFNPKLSDFGLAREGPAAGCTHVSTTVVGTYGYAAPDYIETGRLTSKSDVWSFGVVLYEILTGRRSLERNRPRSEQQLLDWVKHHPSNSKKFSDIMDTRLENQYSLNVARGIAKLADSCLSKSAKDRPKMSEVVEALNQLVEVSSVESPPMEMKYMENALDDSKAIMEEQHEERNDIGGVSESAKRRMEHLDKISENLGGVNRRFLVMQRAKVM